MATGTSSKTVLKRDELYRDRWTNTADDESLLSISGRLSPRELRQYEIFKPYDDRVLEKISPDVSVATWRAGTVLFEEGSYINLAFQVVKGEVMVSVDKVGGETGRSILQTQLDKQRPDHGVTLLTAMDVDLPTGETYTLGPGEFFGEIGALNGWPQSVTARTRVETTLIQIRVPALQEMRRSPALKQRLDDLYRKRSLSAHLHRTPLFKRLDDRFIQALAQRVELVSFEPDEKIVSQGDPADAFYLVRSGFVKLSQRVEAGDVTVTYLAKGSTLGETELMLSPNLAWLWTASSVANTELVRIARTDFETLLRSTPEIERQLWKVASTRVKETGFTRKHVDRSEFIDMALDQGLVEGTSMLVIDLDLCTRCDDCVRACADTHDGIPRFVREGNKYQNLLLTRACFHCKDPLCLIGCPTGAIHRADIGDIVQISENLCIGCRACANNCPYDAIVMHDTKTVWPDDAVPVNKRGKDKVLATKCDLCVDTGHDPACVRNCPQGCAVRVENPDEFRRFVDRRARS